MIGSPYLNDKLGLEKEQWTPKDGSEKQTWPLGRAGNGLLTYTDPTCGA